VAIHRHSPGHLKGTTLARRFDLENVGALNVGEQLDPKFRHSETYRDKGRDQLLSLLVIRRTSVAAIAASGASASQSSRLVRVRFAGCQAYVFGIAVAGRTVP
jgi:hypothetical protein